MAQFIRGDQRERLLTTPVHLDCDRPLKTRLFAAERLAQTPVELRIAGLPESVARMDSLEGNVAVAERERGFRSAPFHRVNASAFFFLVGMPGIEHHAVPGFDRRVKLDEHLSILDPFHLSQVNSALLAKARMRQLLVVDAAKPAGVKATRKGHFQIVTAPALNFGDGLGTAALQSRSSLRTAADR